TARGLARRLAADGYTIVTGGGPGIMQAANRGACEGNGDSVGINIQLPHEQRINPYVRRSISLHYFFSRKVMLDFSAEAYVFFPGGFGTLDEFFELITLSQTGKLERAVPIVLIGRDYWQPLVSWMEATLRDRLGAIAPADLAIWTLTDDLEEATTIIEHGVQTQTQQRFARTGAAHPTPDEKLRQATTPMSGSEQ
ncbi:MAG TPA: TIGR00730 family Rossman fold protein, partial [Ktedonobacterales bacterium]